MADLALPGTGPVNLSKPVLPRPSFAERFPQIRDPASIRKRIETMEHLLEGLVPLPLLGRRVGLDVVLDIIPIGGSLIAAAMGAWIVWEARNLGVSKWTMVKMLGNVGFDFLLGNIPFVGFIPDFFFRSNTRNMKLLKAHLDKHHPRAG